MRILNIEDEPSKHHKIKSAIKERGFEGAEIEWAGDLKTGTALIQKSIASGRRYDLIITDMWYPAEQDGDEEESGEVLIGLAAKKKWISPSSSAPHKIIISRIFWASSGIRKTLTGSRILLISSEN